MRIWKPIDWYANQDGTLRTFRKNPKKTCSLFRKKIAKSPTSFLGWLYFCSPSVRNFSSQQEREFELFQEWIEQRFNQANTQSWTKIILFYSEDESSALERFFELLDEFRLHQQMSAKEKIQI